MKKSLTILIAIVLCLAFSKTSLAQTAASATWAMSTAAVAAPSVSGAVSATTEVLTGLEFNSTSTVGGFTGGRLRGTGNTWPTGQLDYISTKYLEFTVSPTANSFTVSSIGVNMWAASSSTIRASIYYSLNGFTSSTQIRDGNGSGNLSTSTVTAFSYTTPILVPSGSTLTIRIYPFIYNSTSVSGKYFIANNLVVSGSTSALPTLTTTDASEILSTSANSGGNITSDGGASVTARGVCWNTAGTPTTSDSYTSNGTGTGSFSSILTDLTMGTTYYARAYATNSVGTAYGNQISFTTSSSASLPTVTTASITSILPTSAAGGGTVIADGGATVTDRGICWNTSGSPSTADAFQSNGSGLGTFSSTLTPLLSLTTYHVRAYATNSVGTAYGTEVTFNTPLHYYNTPSTDISVPSNWGTDLGGGGTHPSDFTSNNTTYYIYGTGATIGSAVTFSGTGSAVVLGDGTTANSLVIPEAYSLTGTINVSANATLNIQNTSGLTFGTLDPNCQINYDGSSSLTLLAGSYTNLASTNDAGAVRTLPSGTISVSGSFNAGAATYDVTGNTFVFNGSSTQNITSAIFNNLNINNSSVISASNTVILAAGGTLTIAASKTLTVNGVLDNKSVNTVALGGGLIISSSGEYQADVASSKIPAATFQAGSTLHILNSLDAGLGIPASIGGNVICDVSGNLGAWMKSSVTIGGNLTVLNGALNNGTGGSSRTLLVQGNMTISGGEYDIAGTAAVLTNQTLTVSGNLTVNGTAKLYASSNSTAGTVGTINIGGNLIHTAGEIGQALNAVGGAVVFNSSSTAQSIASIGFANSPTITFNNTSSGGLTLGSDLTLNGTLTLTNGVLTLGSQNLILGSAATIAGTPSATAMIYANSTGQLRRSVTTSGSFLFPIGDVSGTAEYTPVTLTASAAAYSSAYLTVNTTRAKHPSNTSSTDYLNRYWTVNASGFTDLVYSGIFNYTTGDVAGSESLIFGAFHSGSTWQNVGNVNVINHNFTTPNLVVLGDFTCADGTVVPTSPIMTVSTSGIGFGHVDRNTTSAEQSYTITGYYLSPAEESITITAPTHFEVSTTSGSGFSSSITLPYTGSTLSATTIYVHFVAPNVTGPTQFTGTLTNTGGGATVQNISLSGTSQISNAELGVNIVVAKDGSGDYTTIQAGINAIPTTHDGISPYKLFIRQGFYHEKVSVPGTISDVLIVGESRDSTILDYTDYVGMSGTSDVPGTSSVETIKINASNITFKNMTIQDTVTRERAVAINITNSADKVTFRDCNIYGHQDTYYFWNCYRVYHINCKITGSVDFIFGTGLAVFDSCSLEVNRNGGVLTAASTTSNFAYGFVFRNCTITSVATGFDGAPITSFYLGRPWQNNPKTTFLQCYEPATLAAAGYTLMNSDPAASVNQNTLYAEYDCYGPGSSYATRATIAGNANYGRQLTLAESQNYTLATIFAAASKTDSPFPNGDWMPEGATTLLPVELSSFTAASVDGKVTLKWKTATEVNSARFEIERSNKAENAAWKSVGSVRSAGISNSPREYSYTDNQLVVGKYNYRLKTVDNDGSYAYSSVIEVTVAAPRVFTVSQNYPNPFNPSTVINFSLPQSGKVSLSIYNVLGQKVMTLLDETLEAGTYQRSFNAAGLASGTYVYQLRAGNSVITKKMLLLK